MDEKKGICVFCGFETAEWWFYHLGLCRCTSCYSKGFIHFPHELEFYETLSFERMLPVFEKAPAL